MATAVGMNFQMTASIAKFQASMDKVEAKLKGIERSGKQTASGMKLLAGIEVGKLLVGGLTKVFNVVSSGVSSVTQFASQAAAAADAIGKLSTMTGMAEEPLQVFTQMAAYGGVSSTQFGDALQKMSRGMGEAANGTGTAKRAIESMGLSVNDLLKMSPSQQFMALGTAIQGIEDPAKRSAAAADIFGRSGTKLIPMFEDLEGNAKATANEMLELGQVLSGTQVDNIEAMNDSFEKVRKTAFTIGQQVLANFAPAITTANERLLEFVKTFEYQGMTGGQAFVQAASDTLKKVVLALSGAFDTFLNTLAGIAKGIASSVSNITGALAIVAPLLPGVGAEDTVGLTNLSLKADHLATQLGKFESNVRGSVASVIDFAESSGEAKQALDFLNGTADKTPSKIELLGRSAEKAAPVVGNLEKAVPGLIGKMGELGGGFVDSVKKVGAWGQSLIDQANASRKIQEQYGSLADVGLVTTRELEKLSIAAAGTGAGADAAKERLAMLAKSGEMLTSVQDRLRNSMMSPIEQFANQRQSFLEQMGFNPFYVEEQKRLWLAKQQEAVNAQIELAKEAYMKFKERIGEGLGLTGPDGDSLLPDTEETLPELEKQTNLLGDVVDGIKGIWENVTLATIG